MKNSNSLDTARDILEKALEKSFDSFFAGEDVWLSGCHQGKIISICNAHPPMKAFDKNDCEIYMGCAVCSQPCNLVAPKEKNKEEFIKALDIEKLIKLIREA